MAYTSAQKAFCSSSTSVCPWRYDVFLSFRRKDTGFNFTDHLYTTLVHKGIKTFRDDTLKRGEEIAPEILKAIEESRFSIVVFSENYANSGWCLNEHVKIMECRKEMEQPVVPIFYHGDPSDVRKQMGSFGEAFSRWRRKSSANLWILAVGVREAAP
ncbi:disease resistance protein RUN1 [Vitis vinifera]|uniref:disease resistance protein RUN1 n=1 Tax=Vitis vinifera TaxID=29760 RepID=UPI0005402022|nr:disease resistance protein RUN1 [Vitis vinifera]|eukprot:XP_010665293.1 PREDICTED: TMV resistance protein N-like [Vitis vinifera]